MGFSVKPEALRTYAGTIGGAGGGGVDLARIYAGRPRSYVDSYVRIDTSSGIAHIFSMILQSNSTLVSHLDDTYSAIASALSESGQGLQQSASTYADTDMSVNARMDRLYRGAGKVTPLDEEATGGTVSDPSGPLNAVPSSDCEVPDPIHWILDLSGWLSIGNDVLKIASILGFDPAGDVTKAIAGDYSMVARAGNAARALGEFESKTAETIAAGLAAMDKDWSGNAADAATSYFRKFANDFEHHASQLTEVGNKYEQVAQAVSEFSSWVSSLLAKAIDRLVACAASVAAASCLQEVPGVNVLIDIVGAYEVFTTMEAVRAFRDACEKLTNVTEAVIALSTGIAGLSMSGDASASFPASGYSNGAQA